MFACGIQTEWVEDRDRKDDKQNLWTFQADIRKTGVCLQSR